MQTKTLFTKGWKFLKTGLKVTLREALADLERFQPVELPHDWLIYDTENLYEDSCGWYLKCFVWERKHAGERVQIRFDGVYMDSTFYVNRQKVGDWKYGYSTFDMDCTDFLKEGENELLLQVRFQSPNSRWYSGAGIYRNVWLKICKSVYLPMDGTYVTIKQTDASKSEFSLEIETEVAGDFTEDTGCHFALWKDGSMVKDLGVVYCEINQKNCQRKAGGLAEEKYIENKCTKVVLKEVIKKPLLWEIEHPECYQLVVTLIGKTGRGKAGKFEGYLCERTDKIWDMQQITIGFRTMMFLPDKGFLLNGKKVKIHGVCEHHDLGCLGAAYNEAAMERKLHTLKAMGVNAIRTSHNMQAPEFMDLADRLGFLVLNEAFDMWERSKTAFDYGRFFKEWAQKDVESWVRRDRNHPSLFMWSIGNEIYDTHADAYGQEITRRLIGYVREHDPKENGQITLGSNYMPWENARRCADIVKIAGYNYGEKYYEEHHKEYGDWVIYGSETASIVQSRGIYHFPLATSILAEEDLQCSALGNSATSWGAKSIEQCITDDRDAEFSFGQFLWTGHDYIGEPTPYHTKNSYFGQIDTAGFPKDAYYIFQAQWTDVKKAPMVHLFPYWDFNKGQLIDVRACTNAPCIELFVNGKSMGKQCIDHVHGKKLVGDWQVKYEPGTITAVAYDALGNVVARQSRHSFGDSKKLSITANKLSMCANEKDLCFLTIETLDENQHPVENAVDYVTVEVKGVGRLLGLDNGDSTDYDAYKGCRRKLFSGKLLAVIGSTKKAGVIEVTVRGEGLEAASILLTAEADSRKEAVYEEGYLENFTHVGEISGQNKDILPVRKIELSSKEELLFTPDRKEILVDAVIYPKQATHKELIWKIVNDSGIDVGFAAVEEIYSHENHHVAKITALGDGDFRVRCMSKSGREHISVLSQLEAKAEGIGQAFLNPYDWIGAGLYTDTIGEIGNGNEKGIATARDGRSGVIFENVDFGEYGSDEVTIPIFALSGEKYPIEVWEGHPLKAGSRLMDMVTYQKPSIWNTYQEETWKLSKRLTGVTTIAFVLEAKIHIKGFHFRFYEKAYERLFAGDANGIYGDSFLRREHFVEEIGNNVTLVFENMDFGKEGADRISLWGRTPLTANTIHIHFTDEEGEKQHQIIEFKGQISNEYVCQSFAIETLRGKGKIEFVFLPGSKFDFASFQFFRKAL